MRAAAPPVSPGPSPRVTAPTVDVSVVIVTYNVREFLEQALDSVRRASRRLSVETFVVDNDSADGSAEMVQARHPDVRLIANEDNPGFAVANNQALREASGRFLLVLNPDTILQEDTLEEMVAFMEAHPETGAVGCRILNPDGTFAPESRRAFPTPSTAFYRVSGLSRLFPRSPRFGRYNMTFLPRDEVCEVDALSGSCMMVRREAIWGTPEGDRRGAGLFDESFFMYGEDLDWCYRIQQAGWTIHYTPTTQIVHYKGESTKKGDLRYVVLFYGAMLRFVEKHVSGQGRRLPGRLAAAALRAGLHTGIFVRASMAALAQTLRAFSRPALDLGVMWAALAVAALAWSLPRGFAFDATTYLLALPFCAASAVAGVGVAGGYRTPRRRTVLAGLATGFLGVATASYLLPTLAFSRGAVLTGFALGAAALLVVRTLRRRRAGGPSRTLVVGSGGEARRLRELSAGRLAMEVVGFVGDGHGEADGPPRLGPARQLRDVARLREVDAVVFAADTLTNTAILDGMRSVSDLDVHPKIFAARRGRLIGKASVEDLTSPTVAADRTVAPPRSEASRRLLDLAVGLLGVAIGPIVAWRARRRPTPQRLHVARLAAQMPDLIAGRRTLVGYAPDGIRPPDAWGLRPGVVSILDLVDEPPASILDAHRAYWRYVQNGSAALDLEIFYRAVTRPPAPPA